MNSVTFRGKIWSVEIQVYEVGLQPAISLIDPDDNTAITATVNVARDGLAYIQDWHFARTQEYSNDPTYGITSALQLSRVIEEELGNCVMKKGLSIKPINGYKLTKYYQDIFDSKMKELQGVNAPVPKTIVNGDK